MQIPGPTLIVTEGSPVSITLTNNLPAAAGNTSILFPGFTVTTGGTGVSGLLTQEAAPGSSVTYTFTPQSPGTRAYYSGTQSDLQVEMGLYGAIIVLPKTSLRTCDGPLRRITAPQEQPTANLISDSPTLPTINPAACYDREYLFQFSEIDPKIHQQVEVAEGQRLRSALRMPRSCYRAVPSEIFHDQRPLHAR